MVGIEKVAVTAEQMARAAELIAERREELGEGSIELNLIAIADAFPRQVVVALMFRFTALAKLIHDEPRFQKFGWGVPTEDSAAMSLQEPVIAAAATEPLLERNDDLVFDPDSFFAAVLQHARVGEA